MVHVFQKLFLLAISRNNLDVGQFATANIFRMRGFTPGIFSHFFRENHEHAELALFLHADDVRYRHVPHAVFCISQQEQIFQLEYAQTF
jgi:hypothetical protein